MPADPKTQNKPFSEISPLEFFYSRKFLNLYKQTVSTAKPETIPKRGLIFIKASFYKLNPYTIPLEMI